MSDEKAEQAASFDRAAEIYERARPSYPDDAVDWLLPEHARVVLDLGAGTGKLTRAIVARGVDCVAVDPSPNMLAQLSQTVPGVRTLEGTAERIPLADGSVDAVLVAQAWHWVDETLAVPEVARVLRPGGTLGLVWNDRDARVPWVAELGRITRQGGSAAIIDDPPNPGPPFGPVERQIVSWEQTLDRAATLDLIRSRSYYITASEEKQRGILTAVGDLLDRTFPDPDVVLVPYRTFAFRARLEG